MKTASKVDAVRAQVESMTRSASTPTAFMEEICKLLNREMLKYNWVGFYLLDESSQPPMLELGAFVGAMTPHTRIPLNQGICGAAASSGKTVVVDDVNKDPRYLACSIETKSEIVVPVFAHGKVAGELDIDSHFPAAFGKEDQALVQFCAEAVGKKLEQSR